MQVTKTDIDQLNARLDITIEPADYTEKVAKQLKEIRHKANIPGFRPGNVPAGLVKKMYGKSVLGEEVNKAISEGLYGYIKENKLNILGDPMPNEEATPAIDWDTQDTFTFAFDIAVAPTFDAKLNGKNKLTYYDIEVSNEMVDNQVKAYSERFGEYVPADNYKEGDLVKGTLTEQVENGLTKENAILFPVYMKNEDQKKLFEGAKTGDIITFNPTVAYESEAEIASLLGIDKAQVAEHKADFTLQVSEITHRQPAEVNAELFAKVYGENNIADEAAFRARIQEEIKANFNQDADYKFGIDAKEAILKKMDGLEFPDAFLKRWALATDEKLTAEKLDEDYPKMIEELKWHLAKDQLATNFEIKIENEDVEAYAKEITRMQFMQYGMGQVEDALLTQYAQQLLKDENQLRGIVERVMENKIFAALKGVVKLDTKSISHEEFAQLMK